MKIKVTKMQMEEIDGLSSEYPYILHQVRLDETLVPWHWHRELEWNYIVKGKVKVHTSLQSYEFQEGEGFFINTNVLCNFENVENCQVESHLFDSILLSGHFKSVFETKYMNPILLNRRIEIIPFYGKTDLEKELLKKLKELGNLQRQENAEFFTRNLLSEMWILLLKQIQETENVGITRENYNQERLISMLSYIHTHYKEKITLEEIAESASISKRECLRCFQQGVRQSPFQYLVAYRIEQAKKMLENTQMSVTMIALETGFSNGAYFCKIFHRECGISPGAYREKRMKEFLVEES